jgi:RHS repeat-associated protein
VSTAGAGTTSWELADELGSVRDVVSAQGTVIDHIQYDSFGNILSQSNPSNGDQFTYAQQQTDATGLNYDQARYYNPATGRFISQDPTGFAAGDVNLYRYCGNGVTYQTDPTGLQDTGTTQSPWWNQSPGVYPGGYAPGVMMSGWPPVTPFPNNSGIFPNWPTNYLGPQPNYSSGVDLGPYLSNNGAGPPPTGMSGNYVFNYPPYPFSPFPTKMGSMYGYPTPPTTFPWYPVTNTLVQQMTGQDVAKNIFNLVTNGGQLPSYLQSGAASGLFQNGGLSGNNGLGVILNPTNPGLSYQFGGSGNYQIQLTTPIKWLGPNYLPDPSGVILSGGFSR